MELSDLTDHAVAKRYRAALNEVNEINLHLRKRGYRVTNFRDHEDLFIPERTTIIAETKEVIAL